LGSDQVAEKKVHALRIDPRNQGSHHLGLDGINLGTCMGLVTGNAWKMLPHLFQLGLVGIYVIGDL